MTATARDQGQDPQSNRVGLNIRVVESNKKAPEFLEYPTSPIEIPENTPPDKDVIATLRAKWVVFFFFFPLSLLSPRPQSEFKFLLSLTLGLSHLIGSFQKISR